MEEINGRDKQIIRGELLDKVASMLVEISNKMSQISDKHSGEYQKLNELFKDLSSKIKTIPKAQKEDMDEIENFLNEIKNI